MEPVTAVEVGTVEVKLPKPLEIGSLQIESRLFTVVALHGADGLSGCAYGLSRGGRVDLEAANRYGRQMLDRKVGSPRDFEAAMQGVDAKSEPASDSPIGISESERARSLIEAALWDLEGKRLGLPLWRMLTTEREPVRVGVDLVCVEGYPERGETPEQEGERLVRRREQGHTRFKMAAEPSWERTVARVEAARAALGPEMNLILDANFGWPPADAVGELGDVLAGVGLDWLEDPFPISARNRFEELAAGVTPPIGAGDDCTDPGAVLDLAESGLIQMVRIDPMTIGGIGPARASAERCQRSGWRASIHVSTEISAHFAFAFEVVDTVEFFPFESPYWGVNGFLAEPEIDPAGGRVKTPETPGTGVRIDWEAAVASARYWQTLGDTTGLKHDKEKR